MINVFSIINTGILIFEEPLYILYGSSFINFAVKYRLYNSLLNELNTNRKSCHSTKDPRIQNTHLYRGTTCDTFSGIVDNLGGNRPIRNPYIL